MIGPRRAWTIARALTGHEINGDSEILPEPFRSMVERMALVVVDESVTGQARREALAAARWPLWQAWLATRSEGERNELADDLAGVEPDDPDGPEPEAEPDEDEAADGWGPIRLGALPPAEPFPLDVMPLRARALAEAAARSIACAVDFVAVAILAAASGLIGRSVVLRIKAGYFASASLYAAIVGGPSSGKSPALCAALAPLWTIARELVDKWRVEMDAWEATAPDDRGEEPELQRLTSTDPTTEALAPILAKNPRGLTIAPDEMTKWAMSMDQYKGGKGGDRPFYLSVWGGDAVFIDRAKHMREPIAVPHPFLTVIGGMTPDMLGTLPEAKGRDDGFLARLLFCYPERPRRRYSEEGIPEAVADDWLRLARSLWDRLMPDIDGKPTPHVVRLSTEAAREWSAWCQAHYAEQEADDFPESLEGPWGKLEAYAARLALILHLMHLAADPTAPAVDAPPELPVSVVRDAARLVAYFKSQARRVYAEMGRKARDGGEDVRALIRWVLRNDLDKFSTRDIARNFDRFRDDPDALTAALGWMADRNLIRPHPEPDSAPKPGRKPAPAFDVNPALKTDPRFRHFRRNPGA